MATAIVKLSEIAAVKTADSLSKRDQRAIKDYIARGRDIDATDKYLLAPFTEAKTVGQPRTVSEVIQILDPNATQSQRTVLTTKINGLLRKTAYGRTLTTGGRVGRVSTAPFWYHDIANCVGYVVAGNLCPLRTAASQRAAFRVAFPKDISPALKEPVRDQVNNWLDLGGVGTKWRAPAKIAQAQTDVKAAIKQVVRENALMIEIASNAKPMIADLVTDAVRELISARRIDLAAAPAAGVA